MNEQCDAIIIFDGKTFHCQNVKGHTGYHSEVGYINNEYRYRLEWEKDMRIKNEKE